MHLLPVTSVLNEGAAPAEDLRLDPAEMLVLSFTDSDLSTLAAAHVAEAAGDAGFPGLRLVPLRRLRHPLSVDLFAARTVPGARFVLARVLGGVEAWRYGLERLSSACRAAGAHLAVLPGCEPDPRLNDLGTVPPDLAEALDGYFRAGGLDNARGLLRRIARELGRPVEAEPPRALPRGFAWEPGRGALDPAVAAAALRGDRPLALVLAYRSAILAGDTAAPEALAEALRARGMAALVLGVSSLKDEEAALAVRGAIEARRPDVILAMTAFSAREGEGFVLDAADCPVLQAVGVGAPREAWAASPRGLGAADLGMALALPEFDGRLGGWPVAFKAEVLDDAGLGAPRRVLAPDAEGVAAAADAAAAWVRLARTPRGARRLALVLSDYPARGGRAGFAVGLDTPASARGLLDALAAEGFDAGTDLSPAALMRELTEGPRTLGLGLDDYRAWLAALPAERAADLVRAWGRPEADPAVSCGAFRWRAVRAGKVLVALQPDRGRGGDRKAGYHDPDAPPCHGYLAFHLALRRSCDALIQLGTHGTAEWLPGKAVALSAACWPRLALGSLPVAYPFIADDPGEAAPAKRRIKAVTLGHLPPPVARGGLHGEAAVLRELVEEYSEARVLDPRRANLVAAEIRERAEAAGLLADLRVTAATPMDEALAALDAHLCDLGEVAYREGLHVFGEGPCGAEERVGLLKALDGRFVPPGPAGSPSRGRLDVVPTGRNLTTLDPRAIPTRAAAALGARAAAEVIRRHLQDEGEPPRAVVMDLWSSPTLRTGGEDVAHALALMGCRPLWDHASTRVTGFEVLPLAKLDHPRADVTVRVSGAFRDTFPDLLALLDRAARTVAALDEPDEWNAPASARRRGEAGARVFGAAPGRFGAGAAREALDGAWETRADLARAYLAATSHAYGAEGEGAADASFRERVRGADAFVHVTDVAERDLLDGDAAPDAVGGFAAAAAHLGAAPRLYSLDASGAEPRARTVAEDVGRLVRGRLTNPRWIEGQLAHGWRGAAELAQGVDALFVLAATSEAVTGAQFDALFRALLGDPATAERLRAANPAAAEAIAARFAEARRRGLWASRLNSAVALDAADEAARPLAEAAA